MNTVYPLNKKTHEKWIYYYHESLKKVACGEKKHANPSLDIFKKSRTQTLNLLQHNHHPTNI